ncbi:hypothetical protein, unknown function [Leishmania tarentolae]|uniref:Uncharacterized protein n=1 Tax=Leishmania tarentolae TaxID=5689 RepID=A0A640KL98_LEITA|nr:hypothetical protein, unknown function [Leishmania tarentolae]
MRFSASTQQLLDELAAREHRVLQQLRELSGMNESPIAPSRPYASLPITPERLNTDSPHQASSKPLPQRPLCPLDATEHQEYQVKKPSWPPQVNVHHDAYDPSCGTVSSLERDLQRLQYLLRHPPLMGTQAAIAKAGKEDGAEVADAKQLQQHLPMTHGDRDVAVAREKRTREAWRPNLSTSPVTPEVKRDRQEMGVYYAPPPPLTPLPSHAEASPHLPENGSTSPARCSAVLSMDDEPRGEDVALTTDALANFSQGASGVITRGAEDQFRRVNATMFPEQSSTKAVVGLQASPYRERDDTVPREACSRQGAASAVAPSAVAWQRSPVRWFSSTQTVTSTSKYTPQKELREEGEEGVTMLCVSALETWAAHHSAHSVPRETEDFHSASISTSPPPTRTSQVSRPPLSSSRTGELSNVHATLRSALPRTSSPPRIAEPSPSVCAKTRPLGVASAALTFLTPSLDENEAAQLFGATLPGKAAPPQETLRRGSGHHNRSVSAEPQTSCAASASPRSVIRTTALCALKAFYTRQSTAGALTTPLWEEGTPSPERQR